MRTTTIRRMATTDPLDHASELLEAAQRFQSAAQEPGCHVAVPETLVSLEEALQVLSAAWYQLAADAARSRQLELQLVGTLHDVAAGFARCASACREGRLTVTPVIARRVAAGRAENRRNGNEFPRFQRHERPGPRVA